jgi:hypothetical protein
LESGDLVTCARQTHFARIEQRSELEAVRTITDSEMENLFELFGVLYEIDRENQMKEKSAKV